MSEPLNPVTIEKSIRECANRIANGVRVCSERYAAYLAADHAYDLAVAHAYLKAEGTATERAKATEIQTEQERTARDVAEGAYKHAERQSKALEAELRALQSVGASVRGMYAVAGRGEGA